MLTDKAFIIEFSASRRSHCNESERMNCHCAVANLDSGLEVRPSALVISS